MFRSIKPLAKLEKALEKKDEAKIIANLTSDALLQVDESKRNPIHLAASWADAEMFEFFCQFAKDNGRSDLFLQADVHGATPLHLAVCSNKKEVVETLLTFLEDKDELATKKLTKKGRLPLDYIAYNQNESDHAAIIALLTSRMRRHNLKKMSVEIDTAAVIARYPDECKDKQFEKILRACCTYANFARKHIKNSHTHLDGYSSDAVGEEILRARRLGDDQVRRIHSEFVRDSLQRESKGAPADIEQEIKLAKKRKTDFINARTELALKGEKGNCAEFAEIVVKLFMEEMPEVLAETFELKNGNHEVVVINRDPLSDPLDFRTWGVNALVCDPWSGEVFLASEIPFKLQYYRADVYDANLKEHFDMVGPIDENCHQCAPHFTNHPLLEVLTKLSPEQQKQYHFIQDEDNQTAFHKLFHVESYSTIKILFQMLDELKDDDYSQALLSLRDNDRQTPLHLCSYHPDPRVIKLFLEQYKKLFSDSLTTLLFGSSLNDTLFFETACKYKNHGAILTVLEFFPELKPQLTLQLNTLFDKYVENDDVQQIETMLKLPNIISSKSLAKAFSYIKTDNIGMFKVLSEKIAKASTPVVAVMQSI